MNTHRQNLPVVDGDTLPQGKVSTPPSPSTLMYAFIFMFWYKRMRRAWLFEISESPSRGYWKQLLLSRPYEYHQYLLVVEGDNLPQGQVSPHPPQPLCMFFIHFYVMIKGMTRTWIFFFFLNLKQVSFFHYKREYQICVKRSKVNIRLSFEQNWKYMSIRWRAPRFNVISQLWRYAKEWKFPIWGYKSNVIFHIWSALDPFPIGWKNWLVLTQRPFLDKKKTTTKIHIPFYWKLESVPLLVSDSFETFCIPAGAGYQNQGR